MADFTTLLIFTLLGLSWMLFISLRNELYSNYLRVYGEEVGYGDIGMQLHNKALKNYYNWVLNPLNWYMWTYKQTFKND